MSNSEEDTYSTIFTSLRHPIRRRILRMLSESPRSFSEMQEVFRIESSHLTYHLENLGSLLFKTNDEKYALSSLGEAAVSMMYHVEEEPPKTVSHLPSPFKRWKALLVTLMVGLILLSSLCYFQYQALTQLSGQFMRLKEESELLQEVLRDALNLGNATLTYEYAENSTVATALVTIENEITRNITHGIAIVSGRNITWISITNPWGLSSDGYPIYSLTNNSTLEIEISFLSHDRPEAYLFIGIGKEVGVPVMWNYSFTYNGTTTWDYYEGEHIYYEVIWSMKATNSSTYSVILPSKGWYCIQIWVPSVWNVTDHYIIDYTLSFRVKSPKNYIPFFARSRMGGFDLGFLLRYDFLRTWILVEKGDP